MDVCVWLVITWNSDCYMCFNIVVSLGSSGFQGYIALHHAFFAHKNIGGELRQRNVASRGVAQDKTGGLIMLICSVSDLQCIYTGNEFTDYSNPVDIPSEGDKANHNSTGRSHEFYTLPLIYCIYVCAGLIILGFSILVAIIAYYTFNAVIAGLYSLLFQ